MEHRKVESKDTLVYLLYDIIINFWKHLLYWYKVEIWYSGLVMPQWISDDCLYVQWFLL